MSSAVPNSLAWAHPLVQKWFVQRFGTPTEPQEQGWPHILAGRTTLISAPTGSGKTLAAFLTCIDALVRKLALNRLRQITGKPIAFDLNAPADARVIAVNALREKLLGGEGTKREH